MPSKRGRKPVKKNETAYRAFLTKFIEDPNFEENSSVKTALDYVYDKIIRINGPLQDTTLSRLTTIILEHKEKILKDLETIKSSPQSIIEPLMAYDSTCKWEKIVNDVFMMNCGNNKRQSDEELTNIICKKLKLSPASEKRQEKNSKNEVAVNANTITNYLTVHKKKNMPSLQEMYKIPVVVLEKIENLEIMAKNKCSHKTDVDNTTDDEGSFSEYEDNYKENQNSDKEAEKEEMGTKVNDEGEKTELSNKNDTCSNYEKVREICNIQDNSPVNESNVQEDSLSNVQSNCNVNDNNINCTYPEGTIYIKQETDLIDDNFEEVNECAISYNNNVILSEIETRQISQFVANSSNPVTSVTNEENISSLEVAHYNTIIPPPQLLSHTNLNPNTSCIFNTNCGSYMVVPIVQHNPNVVIMNPGNVNHGIYNQVPYNPFSQNSMLVPQNFAFMPNQQQFVNQDFYTAQEITKLQTAICNLNTQISTLGNILTTRINTSNFN